MIEKSINVVKRDGRLVEFDSTKISSAIAKAIESTNKNKDENHQIDGKLVSSLLSIKISDQITGILNKDDKDTINIEDIQDIVEKALMSYDSDLAREYILYRERRTKAREYNGNLIKIIMTKTDAKDIVNSNANLDEKSFSGRKNEASSYVQKKIALDYVMPPEIAKAHNEGYIYEHDLDCYNVGNHNCLFIDFETQFANGFSTRNGGIRPPSNYSTACQLVAVIMQAQSQVQYGGVASVHIDTDLAPFVKLSFKKYFKDGLEWAENYVNNGDILDDEIFIDNKKLKSSHEKAYNYAMSMLDREGRQSSEALFHNLNTLESRPGSQLPFSSINYGRDITTEGRLVTKWLFNASLSGIGQNHTTSIFPISIFSYKPGVNANPGDPNYDLKQLALKSLSKRIYPNFANGNWSQAHEDPNDPDTIFATMGKCKCSPCKIFLTLPKGVYILNLVILSNMIKLNIYANG